MRVITKSRLRQFWELPGHEDAEGPLRAWYTHVNSRIVSWESWGDVKVEFGTASIVGNCVVFNIGGNKHRLVTRIATCRKSGRKRRSISTTSSQRLREAKQP